MALLAFGEMFEKTKKAFDGGDFQTAENGLHQLLAQDTRNPLLLYMMGICHMTASPPKNGMAQILYEYAIGQEDVEEAWSIIKGAKEQVMHHLWNNLGCIHRAELRLKTAESCFMKALDYPQGGNYNTFANLAAINLNNGTPYQCIKWSDKVLESDQANSYHKEVATWNKGQALLELGRWAEAWPCFNTNLRSKSKMHRNYHTKRETPWWDGTPGKTVVLFGEQGLGDEVMFASCVNEVAAVSKQVILHPGHRLEGLFKRSFPNCIVYGGHEKENPWWQNLHEIDYCMPLGHLPTMYRLKDSDFPKHQGYMTPDPAMVEHYKWRLSKLGRRPKIGLSWQGGAKETRIDYRSVRPEDFIPFVKGIDADFVSLQYSHGAYDEAKIIGIPHWPDAAEAENMDEVAALIASCDLIVTVCTTAVHIAGALNVPCFVLVPNKPSWRYQIKGAHMPWYPSVRLFRQQKEEIEWSPTLSRVQTAVGEFLNHIGNSTLNSTSEIPILESPATSNTSMSLS